jgi:hypothetical protein
MRRTMRGRRSRSSLRARRGETAAGHGAPAMAGMAESGPDAAQPPVGGQLAIAEVSGSSRLTVPAAKARVAGHVFRPPSRDLQPPSRHGQPRRGDFRRRPRPIESVCRESRIRRSGFFAAPRKTSCTADRDGTERRLIFEQIYTKRGWRVMRSGVAAMELGSAGYPHGAIPASPCAYGCGALYRLQVSMRSCVRILPVIAARILIRCICCSTTRRCVRRWPKPRCGSRYGGCQRNRIATTRPPVKPVRTARKIAARSRGDFPGNLRFFSDRPLE